MMRRPWPILLLAILQVLTPVIYLSFASGFYGISIASAAREVYALSSPLRSFEIFLLPIILGILIFLTKKTAYFIALIGCVYGIVRGVMEFIASNQTDPVFPIIISNVFCIAAIIYLSRATARDVYLNPRVRWWETDPRYVVNLPASVTRVGAAPMKATLENVAAGGAGIETLDAGFLKDEIITIEFQHEGNVYHLNAKIVWARPGTGPKQFLGLRWEAGNSQADLSKVRRLIRDLKTAKTATTRQVPSLLTDLKNRIGMDKSP